ncbi:MAG TPA: hypothetical protein VLJ38_11875 [Polyangiaceae bacterium]|nr:hypothetical protein [Polyangiaceae bacterium]
MSKWRSGEVLRLFLSAALLLAGCGGESARHGAPASDGGATSGMSTTGGAGGSDGSSIANGGTLPSDAGGSGALGGSSAGSSGSMPALPCSNVTCPSIPTSCKRIVQAADACCPTCLDTGCDVCPALDCAEGTHTETVPGDCCPSCVADPPDACATGQQVYADVRAMLLDKYGSSGCSNSTDCTFVSESNACSVTCGVALPLSTAQDFTQTLGSLLTGCATCPAPSELVCKGYVAGCLNGLCAILHPISR